MNGLHTTDTLSSWLGITGVQTVAVIISTAVVYLAFLLLTRIMGQRMLAAMSSYDIIVVIIFGAILGRATMGQTPTLMGGIVAFTTLALLRWCLSKLSRSRRSSRWINNPPILLMAGNKVLDDELRHCRISRLQFYSLLRQAGVRNDDEIAAVIMEPTGKISVLRRGFLIDPVLLEGVRGAEHMPSSLLEG